MVELFWNYSTITIVPSFLVFYTFGSSTIVLSPLFGDHQLDHNRDESNQHNDTFSNLTFEFVFVFFSKNEQYECQKK